MANMCDLDLIDMQIFSDYHIAIEFHLVSMWDPKDKPSWQPTG